MYYGEVTGIPPISVVRLPVNEFGCRKASGTYRLYERAVTF